MKGSRITAVGLVAAAGLWMASGHFMSHENAESRAAVRPKDAPVEKLFRVTVQETKLAPHTQKLILSGRTEADRKVIASTRTSGIIAELKVRRGDRVKEGDVIAVLSDEAREAQVGQARALLAQKKAEWEAKSRLIEQGTLPKLQLVDLEAQHKSAQATLAMAEAERARGFVTAPWSGVINDVPAEVGQAASPGKEIAQIVGLDPMLAVVEVAERKLAGIKVGGEAEIRLVTGRTAKGYIRHVSKSASPTTRTYRVDVAIENADGTIPDGITTEVAIPMAATPATRVPRSALTFSSAGDLGVRVVDGAQKVAFVPVSLVQDDQQFMWVAGMPDSARLIVQGQDFVRETQTVDAVMAPNLEASAQ